jgi:hypothetical protein
MNGVKADGALIRQAGITDLNAVIDICAAHAVFELAVFNPAGLHERLSSALFGHAPRAQVFVAERDQHLIGYAACSGEFST